MVKAGCQIPSATRVMVKAGCQIPGRCKRTNKLTSMFLMFFHLCLEAQMVQIERELLEKDTSKSIRPAVTNCHHVTRPAVCRAQPMEELSEDAAKANPSKRRAKVSAHEQVGRMRDHRRGQKRPILYDSYGSMDSVSYNGL